MTTQTVTANPPKQDLAVEQKIQELRKLYADAPQYVKTALENALPGLTSLVAERTHRRAKALAVLESVKARCPS